MMRHAACALALILAVSVGQSPAFAANNPELSALFYTRDGTDPQPKSLKIRRLELNVDIVGGAAQTRVVASFDNSDKTDAVEGDFVIELAKDSVVTGYAL